MTSFFTAGRDRFLSLYLPFGFLVLALVLERVVGVGCFTSCEDGPVEMLQAVLMLVAFALGLSILRMERAAFPDWARLFFAIGTFGALYVALEEVSYGQRIFGWMTPEGWQALNDQNETNLHNTSSWLDQKPRLILEIGVVIGGLVIPALRKWKPAWLPSKLAIVYPANAVMLTALTAISIHLYDSLTDAFGRQDLFLIERGSELEETYLYWFILLYFFFKRRELRA